MKKKPEPKPKMSKDERDRRKLLDLATAEIEKEKEILKVLYMGDKNDNQDIINRVFHGVDRLKSLLFDLLLDQTPPGEIIESDDFWRQRAENAAKG